MTGTKARVNLARHNGPHFAPAPVPSTNPGVSLPPISAVLKTTHSSKFTKANAGRFYKDNSFKAFERERIREEKEEQERAHDEAKKRATMIQAQRQRVERELEREMEMIRRMEAKLAKKQPSNQTGKQGGKHRSKKEAGGKKGTPAPAAQPKRRRAGRLASNSDINNSEDEYEAWDQHESGHTNSLASPWSEDVSHDDDLFDGPGSLSASVMKDADFLAASGWAHDEAEGDAFDAQVTQWGLGQAGELRASEHENDEADEANDALNGEAGGNGEDLKEMDLCAYMNSRRFGEGECGEAFGGLGPEVQGHEEADWGTEESEHASFPSLASPPDMQAHKHVESHTNNHAEMQPPRGKAHSFPGDEGEDASIPSPVQHPQAQLSPGTGAVRIQCAVRQRQARRRKDIRQRRRAEKMERQRAAITVQAAVRGRQTRGRQRNEPLTIRSARVPRPASPQHAASPSFASEFETYAVRQDRRRSLASLSAQDVGVWLRGQSLDQCAAALASSGVDGAMLADPDLREGDLEECGVRLRLHRRRLIALITDIRVNGGGKVSLIGSSVRSTEHGSASGSATATQQEGSSLHVAPVAREQRHATHHAVDAGRVPLPGGSKASPKLGLCGRARDEHGVVGLKAKGADRPVMKAKGADRPVKTDNSAHEASDEDDDEEEEDFPDDFEDEANETEGLKGLL